MFFFYNDFIKYIQVSFLTILFKSHLYFIKWMQKDINNLLSLAKKKIKYIIFSHTILMGNNTKSFD